MSQQEWKRVPGDNPSPFKRSDLPVDNVSWYAANEFCKKSGLVLPTEAQWEYACRAGSDASFAFGANIAPDQVNCAPAHDEKQDNRRRGTVPVDAMQPNDFGLHGTHGNVWEWCDDVYDRGFYFRPEATQTNPVCREGSRFRVLRGGGWKSRPSACRSAMRVRDLPWNKGGDVGFRPAKVFR